MIICAHTVRTHIYIRRLKESYPSRTPHPRLRDRNILSRNPRIHNNPTITHSITNPMLLPLRQNQRNTHALHEMMFATTNVHDARHAHESPDLAAPLRMDPAKEYTRPAVPIALYDLQQDLRGGWIQARDAVHVEHDVPVMFLTSDSRQRRMSGARAVGLESP